MQKPRIRALSFAVAASTLLLSSAALSQNTPLPSLPPPTQTPSPTPTPTYAPPAEPLPDLPPTPSNERPAPPPSQKIDQPPAGGEEEERAPKRLGVGLDVDLMIPVGSLSNSTGVLLGPLLRAGYRVLPRLELGLRAGFLFGFNHAQPIAADDGSTYSTSQTVIPIWVGGRYFLLHPNSGPYARVEIGVNLLQVHFHPDDAVNGDTSSAEKVHARGGFDVGAGWIVSEKLPIDVHVQFTYLNLLGTQTDAASGISDDPFLGISVGVGYTLSF